MSYSKARTFFGSATLLTGLFACLGSLYSWGEGPIFTVDTPHMSIIGADRRGTAPLALMGSGGRGTNKKWAAART